MDFPNNFDVTDLSFITRMFVIASGLIVATTLAQIAILILNGIRLIEAFICAEFMLRLEYEYCEAFLAFKSHKAICAAVATGF